MVMVFNKSDVQDCSYAFEWMEDFEKFQDALVEEKGFLVDYTRSLNLALEKFYRNFRSVAVSAVTGSGMADLFKAIDEAKKEYDTDFKPMLESRFVSPSNPKKERAGGQAQG